MSKKSKAAKTALVVAGAFAALVAYGATQASATDTASPQVKIYLENNNHNPGTVNVTCGANGPVVNSTLFNDAIGANVIETAVVYVEPANPASGLGTLVAGPVDIPIGGHVAVTLPFKPGTAYNAIAVAKGDPMPTTIADAIAYMTAKPPTADNSQLLPSGYPQTLPVDCPKPTPTPTATKPCVGEPDEVSGKCPCPTAPPVNSVALPAVPKCPPSSAPSTSATSSATPSSSASSSASATPAPVPSGTSPATAATVPAATSTSPAGPALAHTGASVLPYAAGAGVLLAAGGATMLHVRRKRHAQQ